MLPKPVFNVVRKWLQTEVLRQQQEQGFVSITAGLAWTCSGVQGRVRDREFRAAFPKVAQACGLRDDGTRTFSYTDDPAKVQAFLDRTLGKL